MSLSLFLRIRSTRSTPTIRSTNTILQVCSNSHSQKCVCDRTVCAHNRKRALQNCSNRNADECRNNNFITATKSSFMMQKSNLKTSTYNKSIFSFFPFRFAPFFLSLAMSSYRSHSFGRSGSPFLAACLCLCRAGLIFCVFAVYFRCSQSHSNK